MARLAGKVVVILGGTSGIGLSAARACAQAGARILAVGRDDEHLAPAAAELGAHAHVLAADATDPLAAPRAIEAALDRFGGFDALYHVAGGSGRSRGDGPLHELTDAAIAYTLQLNLTSVIYSNRAAAQKLLALKRRGAIVNLTSMLAYAPAPRHFSTHTYAAAKAAVIGLTRSCAATYAPHNIRFNCIAPALVATPMSRRAQTDGNIMAYVRARQPLDGGRIAEPSDCDAAAVYLLSDESRFVTGHVLAVDGGWSVSEGPTP